ncbi:DUF6281 family protein [Streptomyces sp. NPDC000134]|jgi:hypothetical protein|uniref:DUF6281 family protein n=1 Tax=Streptomyces sp. NPDC000134 TaxID=3364536 RepID=UPI0036828393
MMTVPAAACTSGSISGGGERASACAYRVVFQDRTYQDVANVEFTAGDELGPATVPPCDDTGGQDEAEESEEATTAYAVDGISPEVAVAVGDSPDDVVFVAAYSGDELPPEVQDLVDGS